MDTTFTKMCEKAAKIQEMWVPAHGDYYWGIDEIDHWGTPELLFIREQYDIHLLADFDSEGGCFHLEPEHIDKTRHVWLPLQYQLQEIYRLSLSQDVQESSNVWIVIIDTFHDWIFDTLPKISFTPFVTMEQLWLAFVMKEKYNKTWNGKEWERL